MRISNVIVSWSGGKDSLMALWKLSPEYQVAALLTNVSAEQNRVSIHGVRRYLIEAQAAALGLPIQFVELPPKPSNAEYEALVTAAIRPFQDEGIHEIVYGDLFLQDIRQYRDAYLQRIGMSGLYPVWGLDTRALIHEFIDAGFKAIITCVDTTQLDGAFAGRVIDNALIAQLPASVDPCGENGEFHTFVYDGPLFRQPVAFERGDQWTQDERFRSIDLR
ncbi:MAG TPA: diphthine--ammonia ligase [Phototrophicaceae bacterium]|nr:diphthine--ammonia ligase [Phototrophicaceae bacterium]